LILIDYKLKGIHMRRQDITLVEDVFKDEDKDEEEEMVEDVARLFVVILDK